ncbi:Fur family transcriptional regulator [Martelella endophytica]|uniref:Ferric uptake regulation protein n=1 Tax=Martelella endophytica TaxID=1486262 RepID=A0A0D5LSU9_MAREN|nr:Fur family transcriptional regulator [Martelella endophytica]AJY46428.1 Fur family transcriptional regulator [Martelella endophytica]
MSTTAEKLTRNQSLVFDCLSHSAGPLSAYTILDQLRDHGFKAPLQVYRALDKLTDAGLVHRLESMNAYVACAHPDEDCTHHGMTAFAICEGCGAVIEFHAHDIEESLTALARSHNFKPQRMTVEMRGLCAACQN